MDCDLTIVEILVPSLYFSRQSNKSNLGLVGYWISCGGDTIRPLGSSNPMRDPSVKSDPCSI